MKASNKRENIHEIHIGLNLEISTQILASIIPQILHHRLRELFYKYLLGTLVPIPISTIV